MKKYLLRRSGAVLCDTGSASQVYSYSRRYADDDSIIITTFKGITLSASFETTITYRIVFLNCDSSGAEGLW